MIKIGKGTKFKGKIIGKGDIIIGENVTFGDDVRINVTEQLIIRDRCIIGDYFEISGRDIEIDKEFWSGKHCTIGGGSSMDKLSKLRIGYWGHLGDFSFINTARPVTIGNEVGLGQDTRIYTHGAYQSFLKGFPVSFGQVTIGDRVWCPKAMIMPNVTIGHDTVVGAGAIVTRDLPAGCLAVGIPAKVIKEKCYPKKHTKPEIEALLKTFVQHFKSDILGKPRNRHIKQIGNRIFVNGTLFDVGDLRIDGQVTELTEKFKNEFRRYGVRFKFFPKNGVYVPW